MKRLSAAFAAVFVITLGSMARADDAAKSPPAGGSQGAPTEETNPPPFKLFDDELSRQAGSKEGRAAIDDVVKQCDFSGFSRSGPRPAQIAGCEKSIGKAVAVGPAVVPAALRKLNSDSLGYGARLRTYDVLARVADVRTLEPLVSALAKTEAEPQDRDEIVRTLGRISYAKIGETADFGEPQDFDAIAKDWRAWLGAHRGTSRTELLGERIADARAHVGDPDVATAFIAGRFLAQRKETQDEGMAALESLLKRTDLPDGRARSIRYLMESIAPAPKAAPPEKQKNAAPPSKPRALS